MTHETSVSGLPMIGECVEADFEAGTMTFRMEPGYQVVAGKYEIRPVEAALRQSGEVVCYGLRRKGETAIVGVIPPKVHALPPQDPEYREKYLERYEEVPLYLAPKSNAALAEDGEVLVEVSGLTGSGKSAIAGEIEILCKALGLDVRWVNGDEEKFLTHADWTEALELYKPRVRIVERNIPRAALATHDAEKGGAE